MPILLKETRNKLKLNNFVAAMVKNFRKMKESLLINCNGFGQ